MCSYNITNNKCLKRLFQSTFLLVLWLVQARETISQKYLNINECLSNYFVMNTWLLHACWEGLTIKIADRSRYTKVPNSFGHVIGKLHVPKRHVLDHFFSRNWTSCLVPDVFHTTTLLFFLGKHSFFLSFENADNLRTS